ncbi:MAG: ROK family protein, partial [Bacteroidota bacterium]|nr:ROK family protein [Bacteroidota bacterium]
FLSHLVSEMNGEFSTIGGEKFRNVAAKVFSLEDENNLKNFLRGKAKEIPVYGTNRKVTYDPEPRIGVGISKIGASKAIAIGAYAFALNVLDA